MDTATADVLFSILFVVAILILFVVAILAVTPRDYVCKRYVLTPWDSWRRTA